MNTICKQVQWWQLLLQQGTVCEAKKPNQMGVGQYENAATPLKTRGIITTHQYFQMRYNMILIYLKGLKSYQPSNFKCEVSVVKQTLHFYFNQ